MEVLILQAPICKKIATLVSSGAYFVGWNSLDRKPQEDPGDACIAWDWKVSMLQISHKNKSKMVYDQIRVFFQFSRKKSSKMSRIYIEKPKFFLILLLLKWQNLSEKNKLDNQYDQADNI